MAHLSCGARATGGVGRSDDYRRREPRATVLYQTVEEHWPNFRECAEETGGLPRFVEREFEEYLRCGVLEWDYLQRVDGRDRAQIERLCRYITRPPLSQERLTRRADGRLELELKKVVWRDGTRALVLEPFDLLTRLVASVPPPRLHLLRYFGVLSSHSALRREVVPGHRYDPAQRRPPAASGDQLSLPTLGGDDDPNDDRPPPRNRWSWLLAHVFRADLDTCPRCGGPMRWVEVALTQPSIARLLAEHGVGPRPPPHVPRPSLGQLPLPFTR